MFGSGELGEKSMGAGFVSHDPGQNRSMETQKAACVGAMKTINFILFGGASLGIP